MPLSSTPARLGAAAGIGFAAGVTLGVCGWGGSQILRPSLTHPMVLNLTPLAAAGVSVSSLSFSSAAGAGKFFWNEQYDRSAALAVMIPGVIGARWGVRIAEKMGKEMQSLTFNAMSTILIPTHLFVQYRKERIQREEFQRPVPFCGDLTLFSHVTFGLCCGLLSSIMGGVGGMPLTMSYLTLACDMPHHMVQGTAMVAMLPAIWTIAVSLSMAGHTPLATACAVTCGSVVGSLTGASLALSMSEEVLRRTYMLSLLVFGGRSFWGAVQNLRKIYKFGWRA